jgi:hypothetical protein
MFPKHPMSFGFGRIIIRPYNKTQSLTIYTIIIAIVRGDLCLNPENALVDLIE